MPLFIVKIKVDRNEQLLTEVFFVRAFESKWPTFFFWKLLPNSTFFREITKRNKQREKARFLFSEKKVHFVGIEVICNHYNWCRSWWWRIGHGGKCIFRNGTFDQFVPQMNGAKYHLWQILEILSWVIRRISTNALVQK